MRKIILGFIVFVVVINVFSQELKSINNIRSEIKLDVNQKAFIIPDVHGDWKPVNSMLKIHKLIDDRGHWIGGKNIVIFLGDLVDRGSSSLEVISNVIDLQIQAQKSGGIVESLHGNHEELWGIGMHKYIIENEVDRNDITQKLNEQINNNIEFSQKVEQIKIENSSLDVSKIYPDLFYFLRADGVHKSLKGFEGVSIRKWLSNRPTWLKVGNRILSHADISLTDLDISISDINIKFNKYFKHIYGIENLKSSEYEEIMNFCGQLKGTLWNRSLSEPPRRVDFIADRNIFEKDAVKPRSVFNELNYDEYIKYVDFLNQQFNEYQVKLHKHGVVGMITGHTPQTNNEGVSWSERLQRSHIRLDSGMSSGMKKGFVYDKARILEMQNGSISFYGSYLNKGETKSMVLFDSFNEKNVSEFNRGSLELEKYLPTDRLDITRDKRKYLMGDVISKAFAENLKQADIKEFSVLFDVDYTFKETVVSRKNPIEIKNNNTLPDVLIVTQEKAVPEKIKNIFKSENPFYPNKNNYIYTDNPNQKSILNLKKPTLIIYRCNTLFR